VQQPADVSNGVVYGDAQATAQRVCDDDVARRDGQLHVGYAHYVFHVSRLDWSYGFS